MMITKKSLPRRLFLRGVGTSVALPLLDAMVPAMTALAATPAKPVRRLGFVYIPMGANMAQWTPSGDGALTEMSPTLQSLAPFRDRISVVTNCEIKNAYSPGNHATANSAFRMGASRYSAPSPTFRSGATPIRIRRKSCVPSAPIIDSMPLCPAELRRV